MNRLLEIMMETQWAMEPVRLEEFLRQVKRAEAPRASLGRELSTVMDKTLAAGAMDDESYDSPLASGDRPYAMAGPVAVIPLAGVLSKNGSWCTTSMRAVGNALRRAAADPAVRAILLDVDSPGGTVNGTEELAGIVRTVNQVKPVYAYAADLMCSAAYWIGSQGREIAAQASADIGSIGVIQLHADWSKALDDFGVKLTYLSAGKYKAFGNPAEPLTDESRAYLQGGLDGVYALFLSAVAQGRGVDQAKDQARLMAMADGKVFLARAALTAGLIDRIESREAFINHIQQEVLMDLKTLKAQHASVLDEHKKEVLAEAAAAQADAVRSAVSGEQERAIGVIAALLGPELGAKIGEAVKSGVTADQAKAMAALMVPAASQGGQSAKGASQAMLAALAGITEKPVHPAADSQAAVPDFETLVKAEMAKGASRAEATQKVVKEHPKAHAAWKAGLKPKEGGE